MVRTKADGALRVAAGGKAPKKMGSKSHSPSPSPTEKSGRDSFPMNKYCPRETPAWQKKITFFCGKAAKSDEPVVLPAVTEVLKEKNNGRAKRNSSVLDESDEMEAEAIEVSTKKFKSNAHMEVDLQNRHNQDSPVEMDE